MQSVLYSPVAFYPIAEYLCIYVHTAYKIGVFLSGPAFLFYSSMHFYHLFQACPVLIYAFNAVAYKYFSAFNPALVSNQLDKPAADILLFGSQGCDLVEKFFF